jgi:uncharacterized protein YprB with RNaseH-like and TPR domain
MAKIDRTVGRLADKARSGVPSQRPGSNIPQSPFPVEKAFPEAVVDPSGCLTMEHCTPLSPPALHSEAAIRALMAELRLIYGIGEQYTTRLREDGYTTIPDLCSHPRWRDASTALLAQWGRPVDPGTVYRSLERWLPASEPLYLQSLGLVPIEELLFFDLETLGLGGSPIFLAAVGRFVEDGFLIRQTLAPSLGAEAALLERMEDELRGASALLSYNGKSFDWTLLKERFAYYGFPFLEAPIHVDLLHHARRAFGAEIPDCHLGTIEHRVLHIERSNDLPSAEIPIHYTAYLETGNATWLMPIVHHSRQDLASLVVLLDRLLSVAENG